MLSPSAPSPALCVLLCDARAMANNTGPVLCHQQHTEDGHSKAAGGGRALFFSVCLTFLLPHPGSGRTHWFRPRSLLRLCQRRAVFLNHNDLTSSAEASSATPLTAPRPVSRAGVRAGGAGACGKKQTTSKQWGVCRNWLLLALKPPRRTPGKVQRTPLH